MNIDPVHIWIKNAESVLFCEICGHAHSTCSTSSRVQMQGSRDDAPITVFIGKEIRPVSAFSQGIEQHIDSLKVHVLTDVAAKTTHLNGQVIFTMHRAENDAVCNRAINGFNAAENNAVVQDNTLVGNNIAFD